MKLLHVVQHTSAEFLGLMEDHLEGRDIRFRYYRPFTAGRRLPKADALADGLILLGGGPWGSAGSLDLPTLEAEVELAQACLAQEWPLVGIGLGAQIVALAAGGRSDPAPLRFEVSVATRVREDALGGYLPSACPLPVFMRDWPVPPAEALVLAQDAAGRPVLWQIGRRAVGFAGHPGLKVAMVEDLIMEFEEMPADIQAGLADLRLSQQALAEALMPIMTGLVRQMGWMDRPDSA
jgi:GMP synthase-like glutamine amidotransferase